MSCKDFHFWIKAASLLYNHRSLGKEYWEQFSFLSLAPVMRREVKIEKRSEAYRDKR